MEIETGHVSTVRLQGRGKGRGRAGGKRECIIIIVEIAFIGRPWSMDR
jgi:hypothetical protein